MPSLLIQLDQETYRRLNRLAPAVTRTRAQFIREAIRKAILEAEEQRTRAAYIAVPDSESEADSWANPEEYKT